MSLVVMGISHHSAPVTVRERFAFSEREIPEAAREMIQEGIAQEAVILSTCNRTEIYAISPKTAEDAGRSLREFAVRNRGYQGELRDEIYCKADGEGIEHLFKVASGLDSMVLGETEILGQLKKAYQIALSHRLTQKHLNKVFQKAFNTAKLIRTETNIQRGSTSVAAVAVELAGKIFDRLSNQKVMVVGAGDTSEKTARALLNRGAKGIIVANRSLERAEALARELNGRAIGFDEWEREFVNVDIVISSTSAPGYILDAPRLGGLMKERQHRPLLLVDIAVPRDIDPEVNLLNDVYLYNVDDLQAIADESIEQRRKEIERCEALIRKHASELVNGALSFIGSA